MEFVNHLYAAEAELSSSAMQEVLEKLVLLLGPFAPYVAEEMWEELGRTGPVFKQSWPEFDPELAREELAEVVVQTHPVPMRFIGIQDRFGESGTPEQLFIEFGLTATDIARAAEQVIKAK